MSSGVDEEPRAYRDQDDWAYVGNMARGDREKEVLPDSFYGKNVLSDKARSIEESLGVTY